MLPGQLPTVPFSAVGPAGRPLSPSSPLREGETALFSLPPGEPLDLAATLRCGQAFRWREHAGWWYGPYREGSLAVRQDPAGVEVRSVGTEPAAEEAWRFLGLDHSLTAVYQSLAFDPWVEQAVRTAPGLRLLRQDPWECLAAFIVSQNSNIPRIEGCLERIARRWGALLRWDSGVEVAAFPAPEALARVAPAELRAMALGYRSEYLAGAARRLAAGECDLRGLRGGDPAGALAELMAFSGIGRKVADCILLFSLDRAEVCPVDVWVRRVIHELYPAELERYLPGAAARVDKALSHREYAAIAAFARDRWGCLAGYAQQYLFHVRRSGRLAVSG